MAGEWEWERERNDGCFCRHCWRRARIYRHKTVWQQFSGYPKCSEVACVVYLLAELLIVCSLIFISFRFVVLHFRYIYIPYAFFFLFYLNIFISTLHTLSFSRRRRRWESRACILIIYLQRWEGLIEESKKKKRWASGDFFQIVFSFTVWLLRLRPLIKRCKLL